MSNELYHYGVLGMKWGVRRYQNSDGSLTKAGKKRVSKEYEKYAKRGADKITKQYEKMYIDSYNEAAGVMNEGGIDKFNRAQEKKYGKNFSKRIGYEDDYMKEFGKTLDKFMDKKINDFLISDTDIKKAQELIDKYSMQEWHEDAKELYELSNSVKQRNNK